MVDKAKALFIEGNNPVTNWAQSTTVDGIPYAF
jgi:hypothetical protein